MKRWSHLFVGREGELGVLRTAFAEASLGFPKVVAIVAESGFGKTRLVQEFYGWLSTHHDGVGGAGYWPDKLLRQENNLIVNPDAASCGNGVAMPFLWWALRMPDPGARNEILLGPMSAAVDQLKPHLLAQAKVSQLASLGKAAWTEVAKGAGDIATDVAGNLLSFGLLGIGKAVLQTGKALYDLKQKGDELRSLETSPSVVRAQADDQLTTTILADLYRLAIKPPEGVAPIPVVVVIDDAQWLSKDSGCRMFVRSLVDRARREGWPLLVILTTWEREWLESRRRHEDPGCLVDLARGDHIIELGRAPHLEALLVDAFPGLLPEQRDALVDAADGNPRFLDELLEYLERNPKLFVGRDRRLPLTPKGFADAKGRDFLELVADRYATTPEEVRRALGISSLQGVAFSPRLAHSIATRCPFPIQFLQSL